MKPNIAQNVVPRTRSYTQSSYKSGKAVMPRRRVSQYSQRGSVNPATVTMTFGLLAITAMGMLGFFYLQQVVHTASEGADVHALESQIIELRDQQRELELEGAKLRSLQSVEESMSSFNLEPSDNVAYLAPMQDRVAVEH